jgi:glycine betaine catabolism B
MMRPLDRFLDRITMYRLLLYFLLFALLAAVGLSFFHLLPYDPLDIVLSAVFLVAVSVFANTVISYYLKAPSETESVLITALILALIIEPSHPLQNLGFLGWAAVWAMACKYVVAFRRKHLFNPAAFAVVVTSLALGQSASWWVGSPAMAPIILIGGALLVRKMQRWDLVWAFFITVAVTLLGFGIFGHVNLLSASGQLILRSPLLFLAFVMLTEPSTTPPTRNTQMAYGAIVGFLFTPYVHVGTVFFAPEVALLIGNTFAYLWSYRARLQLELTAKHEIAPGTWGFRFHPERPLRFSPGQYLEWTLPHAGADNRGSRRYFTIASSPTEPYVDIGVKFYPAPSSFKEALGRMDLEDPILAAQLAGDFTLPKDRRQKLAFIAGGIGITPFRSMVKYLLDTGQRRPIILLYTVRKAADITYQDVWEKAAAKLGIRTVYVATEESPPTLETRERGSRRGLAPVREGAPARKRKLPPGAARVSMRTGFLTVESLREEIPDYAERLFYVSGPQVMVSAFDDLLREAGVKAGRVKKDYFPGFVA